MAQRSVQLLHAAHPPAFKARAGGHRACSTRCCGSSTGTANSPAPPAELPCAFKMPGSRALPCMHKSHTHRLACAHESDVTACVVAACHTSLLLHAPVAVATQQLALMHGAACSSTHAVARAKHQERSAHSRDRAGASRSSCLGCPCPIVYAGTYYSETRLSGLFYPPFSRSPHRSWTRPPREGSTTAFWLFLQYHNSNAVPLGCSREVTDLPAARSLPAASPACKAGACEGQQLRGSRGQGAAGLDG